LYQEKSGSPAQTTKLVGRRQGDQIGLLFALSIFSKIREEAQIFGQLLSAVRQFCILFNKSMDLAKFWPFFRKLIWSPWRNRVKILCTTMSTPMYHSSIYSYNASVVESITNNIFQSRRIYFSLSRLSRLPVAF
jgi:hypothetical protein